MYFHTTDPRTVTWLSNVFSTAAIEERKVRIDTDEYGNLRIKVGEGIWTHPLASDPDPYRDNGGREKCNHNCTVRVTHPNELHYLDCPVWDFQKENKS